MSLIFWMLWLAITLAVVYFFSRYVVVLKLPHEVAKKRLNEIDSITIVYAMKSKDSE